jgi:dTDP-glucose pyrophosphorylase
VWVNQPEPKELGDAVLQIGHLTGDESFVVHAGDTHIISPNQSVHSRLEDAHLRGHAEATLAIKEVEDPRRYVADVAYKGKENLEVEAVVEKPDQPRSKFAIMPIYIFKPTIFEALRRTTPGSGGEIQLTDAIQKLIDSGHSVQAIKLTQNDVRLDVGTPETYWEALQASYRDALSKKTTRWTT